MMMRSRDGCTGIGRNRCIMIGFILRIRVMRCLVRCLGGKVGVLVERIILIIINRRRKKGFWSMLSIMGLNRKIVEFRLEL